ncbi:MAG TPA: phosphoribosylformylglycinamidine cyclo-ligase [Egibacteraceae bacterium]|nr:phosphoribosylformylglycinamidine cyclo-ligase [Egibacteraceae bacterium]
MSAPRRAGPASTYAAAGVDLAAADAVVERIKPHAARPARPEVLGAVGGFAGLFALDSARWRQPLLAAATDGVGTKLELARRLGRHDTIGIDLVAMVVDDLVVCGAEPLLFLDYLAVERLDPDHVEQVVAGIAAGCAAAGCALLGGETAEHRGLLPAGSYDLAGFAVGVVERDRLLGAHRVRAGDQLVALASTGLHANGYTLARRLVAGLDLGDDHGLRVQSLGEALLRPTRIYAPDCLALAAACEVHAFCHVTGGGIPGNLPRVLPAGTGATVDTATFDVPQVFRLLQRRGPVDEAEMWRVFNMGVGMIAVVAAGARAVEVLRGRSVDAWVCGAVDDSGALRLPGVEG